MKLSENQKIILRYAHENDKITKRIAFQLVGESFEHNADRHVGELLSRLVHYRALIRIKNGLFRLGDGIKNNKIAEKQLGLLEE